MNEPMEIANNLAVMMDTRQFEIDALDDKIKALQAEKKRLSADIEEFKDTLRDAMYQNGVSEIEAPGMFKFKVAKPSPVVAIENEDTLPDEYVRIKREADKTALKKALQSGAEIEGVSLKEGKPRLTITSLAE